MKDHVWTYAEAIREATRDAMQRDEMVHVLGQGLADSGIWGTVPTDMPTRLIETAIAEDAMTGIAIGMAQAGMRPITVDIRMDFALLRMNQIINIAAKHLMWGGQLKCPLVMRMVVGRSWGQGPQHSQALHSFFMHVPGLRVVAPVTPQDAYDCMAEALTLDVPTVIMEHRLLHKMRGPVRKDAVMIHEMTGSDITMVGISHAGIEVRGAIRHLGGESIDAIDLVQLAPLDMDPIISSVKRTGRLLIVDSGWVPCGASAEVAARVAEEVPGTRIVRMGFQHRLCPPSQDGEYDFYPRASTIATAAWKLMTHKVRAFPDHEATDNDFRGPF